VDRENPVEPSDRQHLRDPGWHGREVEVAAMGPHPFQGADEHAEASGVDELDLLEVEHKHPGAVGDQGHDLLAHAWRGRNVDLTAQGHHWRPATITELEPEIHFVRSPRNRPPTTRAEPTYSTLGTRPSGAVPRSN
jgi:hypothetical protein